MTLPTLTVLGSGHGFTAGDINTSGYVAAIPAFQKIYFADGRLQSDGGYHKLDFINTRIVGTVTGTFTKGEVVTQADSDAKGVFDENVGTGATAWSLIYRTTTAEFASGKKITGADSGAYVTPAAAENIVAPPHWVSWTETVGKEGLPEGGASFGCLCFGRIFLNSINNPNQWYAGRAGDPLDWLVSQDDIGTPVSSQTSKAGLVADALTAMIPFKDHYLIFGCENQLWVLRGDPAAGGILTNISYSDGVFSPTSYCYDDENNLYVMTVDGICMLTPDAIINALPPANLTKARLPNLFNSLKLNRRTDRVAMSYDKIRHGLSVSITQADGVWGVKLWIDLRKDGEGKIRAGVFPEQHKEDKYYASAMHYFDSRRGDQRGLLYGCYDGYVRKYDEDYKSDDDTDAIESWVVLGPLTSVEKIRQRLEMNEISLKLGNDTDGITVEVFGEKTGEKVIKKITDGDAADAITTFSNDGLQPSLRQRITAGAVAVLLKNTTADETWIMENLLIDIQDGGKQ